jgi:hypothetical protein
VVKKILIGIGVLVLFLITMAVISVKSAQNNPPPVLTANFTDLSKIDKISKLRSCAGHLTIPQGSNEPKSNMKHYVWVKPEFNKPKTVEIYAPYDGYVADMRSDPNLNLEGEIYISPTQIFGMVPPLGVWTFSVQHIDINPKLKLGDKVKAGDVIGWLAISEKRGFSFDIVYGKTGFPPTTIDGWTNPFADLDSVFNHMTDSAFAPYKEKGIASQSSFVISKEEREQTPCVYGNQPEFSAESQNLPSNWIFLP